MKTITLPITLFLGFTSSSVAVYWGSPEEAIHELLTVAEESSDVSPSGLKIFKISLGTIPENDGPIPTVLRAQLYSLLNYKFEHRNTNSFLPQLWDASQRYKTPFYLWEYLFHARHENESKLLPDVLRRPLLPESKCPPRHHTCDKDSSRGATYLAQLNDAENLSNRQRLFCLELRKAKDGKDKVTGYLEVVHMEDHEYPFAGSQGRIVWDYFDGKVYYSPAHYRPWYFLDNEFKFLDGRNVLTWHMPADIVPASSFFEIVN